MDELVSNRETFSGLRTVRGVADLDRIALDDVAAVDSGKGRVVEAVILDFESAQVTLERFEADRDRQGRVSNQDVIYRLPEIGLPVLELGVVELLQRVRKMERLMT